MPIVIGAEVRTADGDGCSGEAESRWSSCFSQTGNTSAVWSSIGGGRRPCRIGCPTVFTRYTMRLPHPVRGTIEVPRAAAAV